MPKAEVRPGQTHRGSQMHAFAVAFEADDMGSETGWFCYARVGTDEADVAGVSLTVTHEGDVQVRILAPSTVDSTFDWSEVYPDADPVVYRTLLGDHLDAVAEWLSIERETAT
jgi:hypothetical protein